MPYFGMRMAGLSATQFAWKGQRVENVLSNYEQLPIGQWQQLWQESLILDSDENTSWRCRL